MGKILTALRKEIHVLIDDISDHHLSALKPLLVHLADEDDWDEEEAWVVEPANEEEVAMIKEGMREYKKDPSSFIPFDRARYE